MRCQVKLFGPQAQAVGAASVMVTIEPGVTRCEQVLAALGGSYAALRTSLPVSRLAVDFELADATRVLQGNEELALIGLVNGG